MNYLNPDDWQTKFKILKLWARIIHAKLMRFLHTDPLFDPFFRVLKSIEIRRRYKRNLIARKQKMLWLKDRPWLMEDLENQIKEQALDEYDGEVLHKEYLAEKEVKEAQRLASQMKIKLDQFMQFLLYEVEEKQANAYAAEISRLVDINNAKATYERLSEYIDAVIKNHSA